MKKTCHRTIRRPSVPMLINRGLIGDDIETKERMLVEAFAYGWAGPEHFDGLVDMRNALTIAAAHKDDGSILALCDAMRIPMGNIRQRHAETGRMGVSAGELQLMREFVGAYRDFWMRQNVDFYHATIAALQVATTQGANP